MADYRPLIIFMSVLVFEDFPGNPGTIIKNRQSVGPKLVYISQISSTDELGFSSERIFGKPLVAANTLVV